MDNLSTVSPVQCFLSQAGTTREGFCNGKSLFGFNMLWPLYWAKVRSISWIIIIVYKKKKRICTTGLNVIIFLHLVHLKSYHYPGAESQHLPFSRWEKSFLWLLGETDSTHFPHVLTLSLPAQYFLFSVPHRRKRGGRMWNSVLF